MLDNLAGKRIILASKSPRRQELLKGLDISFEIQLKDIDESYPSSLDPHEVPVFLAEKKAAAFMESLTENAIIITSDTIVIQDGDILEKPKSIEEAKEMLHKLEDYSHTVVTGVCIQSLTKIIVFSDHTRVHFMPLTTAEIDYYVEKYQPFDKAGSYGVQEWIGYIGIEKLEGSYFNVMGLPVHKVYAALKEF
jgi:septum formation protein